jgi:hypothetical protein
MTISVTDQNEHNLKKLLCIVNVSIPVRSFNFFLIRNALEKRFTDYSLFIFSYR